jgi:HlyD family secretion protein
LNGIPESRRRRRWPWIAGAILVAAVALVAWQRSRPKAPEYTTVAVERGDIVETVSANGTLNPVTLVSVGTQVSGIVESLHADFNDRVTKDQVLLRLDERTYAAAVRQSEANLRNQQAQVDLAAANLQRAEDLFGKGYISKQELDQARQQARSTSASRDLTRAQVDRDRTNLEFTVIRSPVTGVVVARLVDVGQTVAASFQTPTLFQIAEDLKKMQIDSNFAEADIGRIREGSPVRFTVDAYPDRAFEGRVRQVRLNPKTVQNVVTYNVVVSVDNPEEILLPGMTAYVNVVLSERRDVLRIPNAALRFRPPDAARGAGAAGAPAEGAAPADGRRPGAGASEKGETPARSAANAPSAAGGVAGPAVAPRGDAAGAAGERGGWRGRGDGAGARGRPDGSGRGVANAPRVRTIYVLRDDKLVPVRVTLGPTDRRFTAVLAGELREGDLVVTASANDKGGGQGGRPGGGPPGGPRMF